LKIGLVFSGGGAKGAYEIGVWKAIRKLKLEEQITVLSGTSVGALNCVLFINKDLGKAEKLWRNITIENISKPTAEFLNSNILPFVDKLMLPQLRTTKKYIKSVIQKYISLGMISQTELKNIIESNININAINSFKGSCYICVFNIKMNRPEYIKINQLTKEKIILYSTASTAMPLVFDKVIIDDNEYYDGGIPYFGANTPIMPAVEENCDIIISVITNQWGDFWGKENVPLNTKMWRIAPKEDQWGFIEGTFDFNSKNIRKRINQGYKEGLVVLEEVKKYIETTCPNKHIAN